ncbi:MAG: YceD family protein [Gallionella sp.]
MSAPPFIDSLDFAKNGQQISGEMLIADLSRLSDVLENSQGVLRYTVQGGLDKYGVPMLVLSLSGSCTLRCQRCLGALDYPVALETAVFLRSQAELDALEECDDEAYDSILAQVKLDIQDLLEEEVLLSLPLAPKHEVGACQTTNRDDAQLDVKHPFAALAKLKT